MPRHAPYVPHGVIPAVLEQDDATTFIEPGIRGRVDALGNLIVVRAP